MFSQLSQQSAMTMGLAMPVFAAGADTTTKEAYITKVFNTEVERMLTLHLVQVQQKNGAGVDNLVETKADVTINDASFTTSDGTGTLTKRWAVTFPEYNEAGKYSYKVTETGNSLNLDDKGEKEKWLMSKAEYLLWMYMFPIQQLVAMRFPISLLTKLRMTRVPLKKVL